MMSVHPSELRRALFVLSAFVLMSMVAAPRPAAVAQTASEYRLVRGMNEFGLWAGGSPDSFDFIGTVEDRELLLFGLRYGRVLGAWESVSLEYMLDILPAAVVFEPGNVRRGSSTIYGAGLSPLGFKLNFGQESWIKPFLAASVGFLYFQKDIPVPGSSRFNFTPELGLGAQFFITPKKALTLGYKWHHMSNANSGRSNPGMDSHVFYAGFSFFTP
jgi:opacity protein-like surface antigen